MLPNSTSSCGLALLAALTAAGPSAAADAVLGQGTFDGRSNHVVTGSVSVVDTGSGIEIRLGDDFTLDGAPDPKVAVGAGGERPSTILAVLEENSGAQIYTLTEGVDAAALEEVWIWCEQFDVPLGYAQLASD